MQRKRKVPRNRNPDLNPNSNLYLNRIDNHDANTGVVGRSRAAYAINNTKLVQLLEYLYRVDISEHWTLRCHQAVRTLIVILQCRVAGGGQV